MTARRTDPATSHEAASMAKAFIPSHQASILDALKAFHPIARGAEQIANCLGLEPYAVRKRLSELHKAGMIRPDGIRQTRTGRTERTWRLK